MRTGILLTIVCIACASPPPAANQTAIQIPLATEERTPTTDQKVTSPDTECARVTEIVNEAVTGIERISQEQNASDAESAAGMRRIAAIWNQLGHDLGTLSIATAGLRDTMRDYRHMCRRGATAALDLAAAMEKPGDYAALVAARRAYDEMAAEESGIVDRINAFCQ
jgi:hypothetical protein